MPLSDFLDTTATLKRQAQTPDGSGATQSLPLATVAAGVRCAVWGVNSAMARALGRSDLLGDSIVATATDLGARAADLFVVGGKTYVVQGVYTFGNTAVTSETLAIHDTTLRR